MGIPSLCIYVRSDEIPPNDIEYIDPPEDPGHIPVISLVTFGKDFDFDSF